jgi:hypothetical protein
MCNILKWSVGNFNSTFIIAQPACISPRNAIGESEGVLVVCLTYEWIKTYSCKFFLWLCLLTRVVCNYFFYKFILFMVKIQVVISMLNESFFRLSVMFIALSASTAVAKKPWLNILQCPCLSVLCRRKLQCTLLLKFVHKQFFFIWNHGFSNITVLIKIFVLFSNQMWKLHFLSLKY